MNVMEESPYPKVQVWKDHQNRLWPREEVVLKVGHPRILVAVQVEVAVMVDVQSVSDAPMEEKEVVADQTHHKNLVVVVVVVGEGMVCLWIPLGEELPFFAFKAQDLIESLQHKSRNYDVKEMKTKKKNVFQRNFTDFTQSLLLRFIFHLEHMQVNTRTKTRSVMLFLIFLRNHIQWSFSHIFFCAFS